MVAATLLAIATTYAWVRWPGLLPVGSDNDEYRLVGQALARFDAPVVAGVEGTKYPLGYPALLAAFAWLGLPPAASALVVNVGALLLAVALVAVLVGRPTARQRTNRGAVLGGGAAPPGRANPGAALLAGGVVVTSVAVWNDVYSVMPELLLLAVVCAMLLVVARGPDRRGLGWLTLLAVVAVLLKTLAALLVVGGCAVMWLRVVMAQRTSAAGPGRSSRLGFPVSRLLVPAVSATVVVITGMFAMQGLPTHTTGYTAVFLLADPDDASQGRLTLPEVVRRTVTDVPETLADLGRAIVLVDAGTGTAVVVAVVALTVGVLAAFRLRPGTLFGPFVAGMTLAYVVGLSAWPYHSSRFGIPLVPVAALGLGWLVRVVARRPAPSLAVAGVGVAILVGTSWSALVERAETAQTALTRQHAALDELRTWAEQNLDADDEVVSFDYREIARELDRSVQPVSYTTDPEALLEQIAGADVFVVVEFYPKRTAQAQIVLDAYPDHFEPVLQEENVDVYRVVS